MTHFDYSDEDFKQEFADLTLPPRIFNHTAHLRLAFLILQEYGIEDACVKMCQQIQAFDGHYGDGMKFHHTVTAAAVRTVAHFIRRVPQADFVSLIDTFPRLVSQFRELLLAHYSAERLQTPEAKHTYLAPDLLPYD